MLKITFGRNVLRRRKHLKLSREQLGELANVGRSTIAYIEQQQEKNNPTLDIVESIAKALKMPAWYLLQSDENFSPDHAKELKTFCELFYQLSDRNREKVLEYMRDMIKLQDN